jgi:hypothetical protein
MKENKNILDYDEVLGILARDENGMDRDEPISPFQTNAEHIVKMAGHGSNQTAQKILNKMRDEVGAKKLIDADHTEAKTPKVPKELMETIWESAWSSAQVLTLSRVDKLNIEKEQLLLLIDALKSDTDALNITNDELKVELVQRDSDTAQMVEDHKNEVSEIEPLKSNIEKITEEFEQYKKDSIIEIEQIKKDFAQEKRILDKDIEITKISTDRIIDTLNTTIGELKAMRIAEVKSAKT